MNFIQTPNLPQNKVSLMVVDGRISAENEATLIKQGIQLIKTRKYPGLYEAIAYHPDIFLHHVQSDVILYAPGTDAKLLNDLQSYGFTLIPGETALNSKYPGNIAYNVARVGQYAFHNLKYTDSALRAVLEKKGVELVHVNQGYTKCSVAIIGECSIITSDTAIAEAASRKGIQVLLLEPSEGILLPGLSQGFFGGSTGLIDKNTLALAGNIHHLKSSLKLTNFLLKQGIGILTLSEGPVVDYGSFLPLMTV